jgi:hypothetical protein
MVASGGLDADGREFRRKGLEETILEMTTDEELGHAIARLRDAIAQATNPLCLPEKLPVTRSDEHWPSCLAYPVRKHQKCWRTRLNATNNGLATDPLGANCQIARAGVMEIGGAESDHPDQGSDLFRTGSARESALCSMSTKGKIDNR